MPRLEQAAKLSSVLALLYGAACCAARADDPFLDELARYALRTDGMTVMSGNAMEENAVKQIIDPWPPAVQNRNIPVNGQRMIGAMDRYRNPKEIEGSRLPTLKPIITQSGSGQ